MTRGNFTFYLNGLPYDGADRVLLLAKEEAKRSFSGKASEESQDIKSII